MSPGSECQGFVATPFGRSQSASAFAFISRSTSAEMCVVSKETCPSQARMVLMSTPKRSKWDVGHWKGKTYV